MIENGLFVLGRQETQLHDILCAVHDGKNHGRSEGEENIGEFLVTVGGRGRAMRVSLIHHLFLNISIFRDFNIDYIRSKMSQSRF